LGRSGEVEERKRRGEEKGRSGEWEKGRKGEVEKWRREGEVGARNFKFSTLFLWRMGTWCATEFFFLFLYFAAKNL
jgi:hypothetical protein